MQLGRILSYTVGSILRQKQYLLPFLKSGNRGQGCRILSSCCLDGFQTWRSLSPSGFGDVTKNFSTVFWAGVEGKGVSSPGQQAPQLSPHEIWGFQIDHFQQQFSLKLSFSNLTTAGKYWTYLHVTHESNVLPLPYSWETEA